MSIDADLRTKLLAVLSAAGYDSVPVQQNYASADQGQPRVWYQRRSDSPDTFLSSAEQTVREVTWSVEVDALDPDAGGAVADLIQSSHPAGMHGFSGRMGSTQVLGCWAEDAGDEYQPRGLDLDDGYHVSAFNLKMIV